MKILNFSILVLTLLALSSCCVFVKDRQSSQLSPSETMVCFMDAIQQEDYHAVGAYLSDKTLEGFICMLSSFGNLKQGLESDPAFIGFLNESGLELDEVVEMPESDIIGLIFISTAHEDPDIFNYEILGEEIHGDTAIVYFKSDSEVEIPMIKQDGQWKISFELWD
ncbi:MAG: hypothetical protein APR63_10705 [Desulfuromonas sp. SDB]|nr:MAG: hypothetical protein APR63_10705 [Desulfuromonas sp. SDB]